MNLVELTPPASRPLAIKLIGLGGAGVNMAGHIAGGDLAGLPLAVMHTNARELERCTANEKLLLGANRLRGLGSGGDPDLARAAAEEHLDELKALCAGADLIFIVAGLGGGTGTGVAPVLAQLARESGALVLGLAALPFDFESEARMRQARLGLQRLCRTADGVLCLHNQRVSQMFGHHAPALEIFQAANHFLAEGAQAIHRLLTAQGFLNVSFADLASVLRGQHVESSFATAAASGEGRARVSLEKLLSHPLLLGGEALAEAGSILLSISGSPDLAMAEIEQVVEAVRGRTRDARMVVGAAVDDKVQNAISITVVASKHTSLEMVPQAAEIAVPVDDAAGRASGGEWIEGAFFAQPSSTRAPARYTPPAPELPIEKKLELFAQQTGRRARKGKGGSRWRQGQLPLEIVSKGRFDQSEPTIHHGEDLDVPTFIRRGIKLN